MIETTNQCFYSQQYQARSPRRPQCHHDFPPSTLSGCADCARARRQSPKCVLIPLSGGQDLHTVYASSQQPPPKCRNVIFYAYINIYTQYLCVSAKLIDYRTYKNKTFRLLTFNHYLFDWHPQGSFHVESGRNGPGSGAQDMGKVKPSLLEVRKIVFRKFGQDRTNHYFSTLQCLGGSYGVQEKSKS